MSRSLSTVAAVCDHRFDGAAVIDRRYRKADATVVDRRYREAGAAVVDRCYRGWVVGVLCLLLGVAAVGADTPAAPLPARERGLPLIRNFLPREYKGREQIWAITEAPGGVMLFASMDLVIEFDGQTWRSIPVPGGSYLRAMATDATGTVWVAGDNEFGRLVPGPDGRLAYESMRARVPAELGNLGPIWCAHARPDGLYLQGNVALLRWDGAKFDAWPINARSTALSYPYGDTLAVARDDGWFLARPGGKWEQVGGAELAPILPRALLRRADGSWLAATGAKGLFDFLPDGTLRPHPTEVDEWLKAKKPYKGAVLPDGRVLFTSIQGGAVLLSADLKFELLLDESAGLATQTVISAYVDRRGVLWLGTDRGISRVELRSPLTFFNPLHGLGHGGVEAMERVDGRVTVTSTQGVHVLKPAETGVAQARFESVDRGRDRINTFLRLPDGMLSGGLTGLFWTSNGRTEMVESPSGIREIVQSPTQPGRFFGTHLNGLCSWRREGGRWVYEGAWPELSGELRVIVFDRDGSLWTSTSNEGVLRVIPDPAAGRATRIERYGDADGLPTGRHRVWMDEIGGAPLFRTSQGMFRFDETTRRFRPDPVFTRELVGADRQVRLTTSDDHGGLGLATESADGRPREILYVRGGQVERLPIPTFEPVGTLNFMNWERSGGSEILWIGSQAVLVQVDIGRWRSEPPALPSFTLLRDVQAGGRGRAVPPGVVPEFEAVSNTLRFAFATPGLSAETTPLHETRLRGFRDGDTQTSTATERTFTNLPAGRYTFEARGRSEDGRWSQPASLTFVVLAPWWQTPAAIALWVVLGGLLLFTYIRWRIRGLRRERARLERVVAERTAELARKNAELQRLHHLDQDEKLAAQLAEEKARLELLRYQLNPHFLYNSLNSIRALVYSNAEAAGEMVTRLSEFCRWTLTRSSDAMTTVAEETEMLQAYLDIERTRWQEALVTRMAVDPAVRGEPIPQFLLLPLVENAIKYGGKTSPDVLEVEVTVRADGAEVLCEVANTGHWVDLNGETSRESTQIGLENLKQRLRRHYGPERGVLVVKQPGWVRVQLRLPRAAATAPKAETEAV